MAGSANIAWLQANEVVITLQIINTVGSGVTANSVQNVYNFATSPPINVLAGENYLDTAAHCLNPLIFKVVMSGSGTGTTSLSLYKNAALQQTIVYSGAATYTFNTISVDNGDSILLQIDP